MRVSIDPDPAKAVYLIKPGSEMPTVVMPDVSGGTAWLYFKSREHLRATAQAMLLLSAPPVAAMSEAEMVEETMVRR